jgi:hypothetical protein
MVIVLTFAAIVGGIGAAAALWSSGWVIALLSAPFAGSLFALVIAITVAALRSGRRRVDAQPQAASREFAL